MLPWTFKLLSLRYENKCLKTHKQLQHVGLKTFKQKTPKQNNEKQLNIQMKTLSYSPDIC